ncbi:RTA1 domain-containing protein [Beauveria bassiana ARSEF 2860]|uniref:RTA1 domain-containing protein n=1 Tax=Beauveria bassiana (strain ARSEF 2860) TaxID=655819 RepID=J5K1H0_BEAB2|nr:RTA1 domain-containing protein [Beauveria bassiana ARSEF 2860]EJP68056.1 RTA1 domain-containing protein [Beauveria bassiana ARSEF 2860]
MATLTTNIATLTRRTAASPSCTTAVPDNHGHVPFGACNSYYNDDPSFEANLAFAALFGASFLAHIVQAIAYKKRFCWVLIMGAAWETAAFSNRTLGAHNQQERQDQRLCVYDGRPHGLFGLPDKKIWGVRAVKLTVLFVWLDVVCFLVQLGGGLLLSNDDNRNLAPIGMKLYTAGIALQLGFVVIFGVMTGWFYHRMRQVSQGKGMGRRLQILTWTMLAVLVLIIVRVIFRLLEFGPGIDASNELITNEMYPLALDALPMVIALVLLNVMHPGLVLRGPDGEFPHKTRGEKKAIRQRAKEEKKRRKEARKTGEFSDSHDMERLAEQTDGDDMGPVHDRV